ncbi:unnamed protein product [Closterium sp. Naga37s-1]|nr:unnamed protein product [Closterium sp. Naga37s-1]
MARKRKSALDTRDSCPQDLNEIPYIGWMNKQIAAGRKPGGPVPEGIPSPGGTSFEAPRDVPSRGRRGSDRVASSRTVEDDTFVNEDEESDYNEYDVGTDGDDSGDEEDKGMFEDDDDEAEGEDDEALEEAQHETQAARRGRPKTASGVKTREQENAILVAARWFTKDELEPLIEKQGSQYWAHLVLHIEKENPGWVCSSNAVQKQWCNLVRIYKQLKKGVKASEKGAVCKPRWWPYMELYHNNRATVDPHVVDGGARCPAEPRVARGRCLCPVALPWGAARDPRCPVALPWGAALGPRCPVATPWGAALGPRCPVATSWGAALGPR